MIFPLFVISLAFIADRISKWWATDFLAENGGGPISPLFAIQETYNRGLAFGLFQGTGQVMGWISLLIIVPMLIYLYRVPRPLWILRLGLALIVGGALGNMLDRIVAGQVLDFIVSSIRPGVFNVADVCINVGMILALIGVLFHRPAALEPVSSPDSELP